MPFDLPPAESIAFHILSIQGPEKSGKSHLAYQAPKKMAIQSTDRGWDGLIQKQEGYDPAHFLIGENHKGSGAYYFDVDLSADELMKANRKDEAYSAADAQAEKATKEVWTPFQKDYYLMLEHREVRSIVWDLADEEYDFLRLANFGKLERNSQLGYVGVNAEYLGMIRKAHRYRKNLILVNRMGPIYKQVLDSETGKEKSVATGEMKRKGPAHVENLVHSFVQTKYVPPKRDAKGEVVAGGEGKWLVEILRARFNPQEVGRVLENPDFVTLMMYLAPDTNPEVWL